MYGLWDDDYAESHVVAVATSLESILPCGVQVNIPIPGIANGICAIAANIAAATVDFAATICCKVLKTETLVFADCIGVSSKSIIFQKKDIKISQMINLSRKSASELVTLQQ
jgi:hypothetical protein